VEEKDFDLVAKDLMKTLGEVEDEFGKQKEKHQEEDHHWQQLCSTDGQIEG